MTLAPGDPAIDVSIIQPFAASYTQLGTPFEVQLRRLDTEPATFSFLMILRTRSGGLGVDHVGIDAGDLSFAYRRFGFGRWGPEYLQVEEDTGTVTMLRMSLAPDGYSERRLVQRRLERPVFDGTVAYWLLAAAPLDPGARITLPTIHWTEESFDIGDTTFEVEGREPLELPDGSAENAWVVVGRGADVEIRSWIVRRPPYLLRQEMIQGGQRTIVLELAGG